MQLEIPVAFLAESIGFGEVFFLFVVILALFGPRRLPEIARQIGKTMAELRRASQGFRDQMMQIEAEVTAEKPGPPKAVPAKELPAFTPWPSAGADIPPAAADVPPVGAGTVAVVPDAGARAADAGSATPRKEAHARAARTG